MRLVQRYPSLRPRGLALCWLVGSHMDRALQEALPGWGIVASDQAPLGVSQGDVQAARVLAGAPPDAGLLLIGYSAGCQSVRAALIGRAVPEDLIRGVAVFDGTHSSIPPNPVHIDVWRRLLGRAREGSVRLVMTATSMGYTERIPVGQPGRATSTRHVLEAALGHVLEVGQPVQAPGLHVELFPSQDIDREAHIQQQREVMPRLLASVFGRAEGLSLTSEVLAPVRALGEGLAEFIAASLARSEPPPSRAPHGYRCSVAELVSDARALGTWRDRDAHVPQPGDLAISGRLGQDPRTGGSGHVERVEGTYPEGLITIGGNEGDTWTRAPLDLGRVLGWIVYPDDLGLRALAAARAELARGIREVRGPGSHPRIQEYHAGARRGGPPRAGLGQQGGRRVLGPKASDEVPWCASAASWCCARALEGS